ncbi:hypothetical protein [Microvirga sp. VF16]|uniref:hypothetical protein n=1 Tax=Microvirga sp. VF16 TaxID=2807101 RepID=UPI00193D198B|nr:hypothetical protein [Microvirga sp. VF16]QRM34389.1 hypothetical protein JO965_34880 [Microvirga sp. VF16]
MKYLLTFLMLVALSVATPSHAGNTSSNSSSNSSNGVHTRVDTVITDEGRGRTVYERRVYRQRERDDDRSKRRWPRGEDDN